MKKKVSIIGAGNVGATIAQIIAFHGIADIVLFDIIKDLPQGKALDIAEACPLWSSSSHIIGTNNFNALRGSDIIVITAGSARKPGMSRDDLLHINTNVVKGISREILKYCPDSIIIVVTNPMDVMSQVVWLTSNLPTSRIMGMGGVLDSARLRTFIAWELGVSPEVIDTLVLGGHGDQMVPMPRFTTVKGIPITELLNKDRIESLIQRTRNGGAEVVSLLKSASAYYAPAASTFQMIKAIIFNEKSLLPAASYLNGEYGYEGIYVGVPVVLGKDGIEKIVQLNLNEQEKRDFENSVSGVRNLLGKLKI